MATKRVKLSELKQVIKELIKEEYQEKYFDVEQTYTNPSNSSFSPIAYKSMMDDTMDFVGGQQRWDAMSEQERVDATSFIGKNFFRNAYEGNYVSESEDNTNLSYHPITYDNTLPNAVAYVGGHSAWALLDLKQRIDAYTNIINNPPTEAYPDDHNKSFNINTVN